MDLDNDDNDVHYSLVLIIQMKPIHYEFIIDSSNE